MLFSIRHSGFCWFFILSLFVVSCGAGTKSEPAPDFKAELIDGTQFKLSDLRGQYVVLDFWGSWCGPCRGDMPKLAALHTKYGNQVAFVSVALEKNDKYWKTVAENAGFTWKYQIVKKTKFVMMSALARKYGVTDIPAKFIITPDGNLISGLNFEQMDAYLTASLKE